MKQTRRLLFTALLLSVLLLAVGSRTLQASTTTVTLPIHAPDDVGINGNVLIRISAPCRSGSNYVVDKTINVKVTAGVFSVNLVPNDTCVPSGTSYSVVWLPTGGAARTQTWVVPTSSSPVSVDSVIVTTTPSTWLVQWQQMVWGGATVGQKPCFDGAPGALGSCGSGTWGGGSNGETTWGGNS